MYSSLFWILKIHAIRFPKWASWQDVYHWAINLTLITAKPSINNIYIIFIKIIIGLMQPLILNKVYKAVQFVS